MPTARRTSNFQGRNFRKRRRADAMTQRRRSRLMSRIRAYGSKMEVNFVATLKLRCEHSFEINDRDVFGKPDIVFRQEKICIFLDSDFWHGWQYPRWKHLLKTEFWRQKIQRNRERDRQVTRRLRRQGWTVIRFWEHNLDSKIEGAIALVMSHIREKNRHLLRFTRTHQHFHAFTTTATHGILVDPRFPDWSSLRKV